MEPGPTQPILDFLKQRCGQRVEHCTATVHADLLMNCDVAEVLPYGPNTPVLLIDDVGCNTQEQRVHRSVEYHPDERMRFELVRRRALV